MRTLTHLYIWAMMLLSTLIGHSGAFRSSVVARRALGARLFSSPPEVEEVDPGTIGGLMILKWPHPSLRAPNTDVNDFDDSLKHLR